MDLFYDLYQTGQIHAARAKAASASAKASTAAAEIDALEERVDRLVLVNRALWELLAERHGLTEADLVERVREIDLRDGREDGRMTKAIQKCVECGRTLSRRHRRCLYCGADRLDADAFDAVQ